MMASRAVFFVVFSFCTVAQAATTANNDDVQTSLKSFTTVYDLVEKNFADRVDPEKAVYSGAIPGMLRTLDPHSTFLDPQAYAQSREEQRGNYFGVGMKVQQRSAAGTSVTEPFKNSPAWKAGLRPGDLIIAVDDANTRGMAIEQVIEKLKGPRGTSVKIAVEREGSAKPFEVNVVRDAILVPSVPPAINLGNGIWYIKILEFDETTAKGFEDDFRQIGESNISGLILDLRGNPGGLITEAVAVADKLLTKGDVIVSHHGRSSKEEVYKARNGNGGHLYPIVVVVNRSSASASEIVTGALQDHDRAFVFGENTFGKGLVQSVFSLGDNTGLHLTTARYYTPSGRLIQRDYTHASFFDYYFKANTEARNLDDVKTTDSGRTVYGGGGISPDKKFTVQKRDGFQTELLRNSAFFSFTSFYRGKENPVVTDSWSADDKVISAFHDYLSQKHIPFTESAFTADRAWVKNQLTYEMYWSALSSDDARAFDRRNDPEVLQAIQLLPQAQAFLSSAQKLVAQRKIK